MELSAYTLEVLGQDGQFILEEYIRGKDLDYYLRKAIYDRDDASLKERFSALPLIGFT